MQAVKEDGWRFCAGCQRRWMEIPCRLSEKMDGDSVRAVKEYDGACHIKIMNKPCVQDRKYAYIHKKERLGKYDE